MSNDIDPWDWSPERNLFRSFSPKVGAIVEYVAAARERATRRSRQVIQTALSESGLDPDEALSRLTTNDRISILCEMAVEAARRSHTEGKAVALGRALASGLLANDEALVDEAQFLVATIDAIEAPHLRALMALLEPSQEAGKEEASELGYLGLIMNALGPGSRDVSRAIVASLVSHGLVEIDPPGFGGFRITAYGERVMNFLKEAGSDS